MSINPTNPKATHWLDTAQVDYLVSRVVSHNKKQTEIENEKLLVELTTSINATLDMHLILLDTEVVFQSRQAFYPLLTATVDGKEAVLVLSLGLPMWGNQRALYAQWLGADGDQLMPALRVTNFEQFACYAGFKPAIKHKDIHSGLKKYLNIS